MSQAAPELEPCTIYIKNIHFRATANDLAEFFSQKYGPVKKANILSELYRGQSVSKGVGFIEFQEAATLEKVMEDIEKIKNGGERIIFRYRSLFIQRARVRRQHKRDTAFIGGISMGVTIDDIKEAFKAYSPVDAKIVGIINENRKGFAFIKFASAEQRNKAVRENKTIKIKGNDSVVRYARRDFDDNQKRTITRYRRRRNFRRAPRRNNQAPQ